MTNTVEIVRQTIGISEVAHVDVTEIATDPTTGMPLREVRVYAGPSGRGAPPVVTLRLSAPVAEALKVQTPELMF